MEREYKYPVWGTQGGGLVREVNGIYIFVEKPNCPGLDVGDEMPDEWGIVPANQSARDEQNEVLQMLLGLRPVAGTDPDFDYELGKPKV